MRKVVFFILILFLGSALACKAQSALQSPPTLDFPTLPFPPLETPSPTMNRTEPAPVQTASPAIALTSPLPSLTPGAAASNATLPAIPTRFPAQTYAALTPPAGFLAYYAQSGDTLQVVAAHFGVKPWRISSPQSIPEQGFISPGQPLLIPDVVTNAPYATPILPDSEVINSSTAIGFDIQAFVQQAGGFLSVYSQDIDGEHLSGAEIVQRIADNTSVHPRLLLAFLEFRTQWVYSTPASPDLEYPLDLRVVENQGLFLQLSMAAKLMNIGYYSWRDGSMTELFFPDGDWARPAPALNAGTLAVQYLFARLFNRASWVDSLYGPDGFVALYERMFGDPWQRAARVEPLYPPQLLPPVLELPFTRGEVWRLTSGLHPDWNTGTPAGALDFAPSPPEPPCQVSAKWVRASAAGLVIRARAGIVLLDLDMDGNEQTGWVLFYIHIAEKERVKVGARLNVDDLIGHPSCEGGDATGTHVHLARKFNGEWIGAGPAVPLTLSGWTAVAGEALYAGTLVKGDQVVTAFPNGTWHNTIVR